MAFYGTVSVGIKEVIKVLEVLLDRDVVQLQNNNNDENQLKKCNNNDVTKMFKIS